MEIRIVIIDVAIRIINEVDWKPSHRIFLTALKKNQASIKMFFITKKQGGNNLWAIVVFNGF